MGCFQKFQFIIAAADDMVMDAASSVSADDDYLLQVVGSRRQCLKSYRQPKGITPPTCLVTQPPVGDQ